MKSLSNKKHFVRSFCAGSIASIILISSLVSVAAAIAGASSPESERVQTSSVTESITKTAVIDVNGKRMTKNFTGETVEELLGTANITLNDNQIVIPSLTATVTPYMVVTVRDAKQVKLTADGKTHQVMLPLGKVADSLKLAGIALEKDDIISVSRDADVKTINELKIRRVTYSQLMETRPVPFEKKTEESDKVEPGETKVVTEGKNGEKQVVKSVKYVDGKPVEEKVVSEKVTKKPVDEVTLTGAKGVGTFTDQSGAKVAYKAVYTGSGTAYTAPAGALTATGVSAYNGGVAIDPSIIPYGSKLYVEAVDGSIVYGYCTAVDTGGFCDDGSGIVDVFYDTYDECVNWGRRDVNVYVIE